MTIFSTNLEGGMALLALPWLHLCFGPPFGNFLRMPLVKGLQSAVEMFITNAKSLLNATINNSYNCSFETLVTALFVFIQYLHQCIGKVEYFRFLKA